MSRELSYSEAIREALDQCLDRDPAVYLLGLGVPDPKGVFGSTLDLHRKYGPERVLDMPTAENGMTGIALGSALTGLRPVMTHQRIDFAILAMEQIVNQAAKWHYMFGGQRPVPLVIRMIVGRGWGQGPQHSQSLQAWFAHVPGLKVILPATPADAKGLLIAAVEDDNPVICIEHRWCYNVRGPVPAAPFRVPIGEARVAREGTDLTIAALSYMSLEAARAAEQLAAEGIQAEVLDLRAARPLDTDRLLASVRKTGRLLVADTGWTSYGVGAEVVARVAEAALTDLRSPPRRIALPDCPTPTSPALAARYYPRAEELAAAAREMLGRLPVPPGPAPKVPLDVPDPWFTGPF